MSQDDSKESKKTGLAVYQSSKNYETGTHKKIRWDCTKIHPTLNMVQLIENQTKFRILMDGYYSFTLSFEIERADKVKDQPNCLFLGCDQADILRGAFGKYQDSVHLRSCLRCSKGNIIYVYLWKNDGFSWEAGANPFNEFIIEKLNV